MTEDEAQGWLRERFGADAVDRILRFIDLVLKENGHQNLISPGTVDRVWMRHVADSAQLVPLAPAEGSWLDIGTGGGFPGMIVALVRPQPTLLVEPRKRRAAFLEQAADALGIARQVTVVARKVEQIEATAAVISARAVASVENLLHAALPCATSTTRWLLPRGQLDQADMVQLRERWRGVFHVEQSLTDPASSILIAEGVGPR